VTLAPWVKLSAPAVLVTLLQINVTMWCALQAQASSELWANNGARARRPFIPHLQHLWLNAKAAQARGVQAEKNWTGKHSKYTMVSICYVSTKFNIKLLVAGKNLVCSQSSRNEYF